MKCVFRILKVSKVMWTNITMPPSPCLFFLE
jgi:hypothetical protein